MFDSYETATRLVNGIDIHYRVGGSGPGLLLLHGHPQTHFIWHKVAAELANHFTVIAPDLRGYGDSSRPGISDNNIAYSKRVMAIDQMELMKALGFGNFSVLAHDRGARVAHRLALDHAHAVDRMILLDIAPTLAMYEQTHEAFARAYWHWFFLIRPAPFPESLIEHDPESYLRNVMGTRSAGMNPFTKQAFAEYLRCLKLPGSATAVCEDYRASAGIDLEHDRASVAAKQKVNCPLLMRWGDKGAVGQCFDPLAEWQKIATDVRGGPLASGHYIPEEAPEAVLEDTLSFLKQ